MGTYSYFEHDADMGIIGEGESVEKAFESAAEGMFAIMAETLPVPLESEIDFEFDEEDTEIAFVRWLNYLIAYSQSRSLILGKFELKRNGTIWYGKAWGVPWNKEIVRGVEVKGATLTMLSVECKGSIWKARCIVDV